MTNNLPFIDTHAHLSMLAGRGIDAEEKVRRLFMAGFAGIIDIGTRADDLADRVRVYSKYRGIKFSAGLWPSQEAITQRHSLAEALEKQVLSVDRTLLAAIGECGLDRYHNKAGGNISLLKEEGELLELQLGLARRLGLPVIIHTREAADETAGILSLYPGVRGIIHCFSYGAEAARVFLDMGYYISFAGNLTYRNTLPVQEALAIVPGDRLLFETDAPFLAPVPHRGKPADPGMVSETYRTAAALRKCRIEDLAEQVRLNAAELFGSFTG